jgi:hypothetical protein
MGATVKRVPVTTYLVEDRGVPYFRVHTLCGQGWMGRLMTEDTAIITRRALSHAEECALCEARWRELSTPGTLVSTGDQGYAHEDSCRCYDCRPQLHED